mmetsp:Transcript_18528/g.30366  ORF Transcript_18528/g.30366 Transcript_18528/m.30366 type:complete len:322 (+) Transcript_18528:403-1368(+)
MRLDRGQNLRMLRQFLIRRIPDIVPFGPVAHRCQVNVDKGGTLRTFVAENHSLQNVGKKLKLILNVFRCKQRSIRHFAHVFGPVNNPQMASIGLNEPGVARGHPAFGILGVGCAVGVLVILHKHAGRPVKHLAIVRDFQLNAGTLHAHRVAAHFAIRLRGDEHGCFGLAVKLLQVDAQRSIEIKDFRANGLTGGVTDTHAAKAQRVFQWAVNHEFTQMIFHPVKQAHILAVQNAGTDLARMLHEIVEQALLELARILHPDHHVGQLRFKHARRGEIVSRPNLAQIHMHRFGAFGAVCTEPRPKGLAHGKDEIAHPGHWQIG